MWASRKSDKHPESYAPMECQDISSDMALLDSRARYHHQVTDAVYSAPEGEGWVAGSSDVACGFFRVLVISQGSHQELERD